MSDINDKHRILVGLNEILDIRLGTLITINPEFGSVIGKNKNYYNRKIDKFHTNEFGTLSIDNFIKFKNLNRNTILRNSIVTCIPKMINEFIYVIYSNKENNPTWKSVEIDINISEYELTVVEQNDLLKLFRSLLSINVECKIVNIPLINLTPSYINDNYTVVYMYEYYDYINLHTKSFKTKGIENTIFYVPKVLFLDKYNKEEEDLLAKETGKDIYEITKLTLSPFINLEYIDIEIFSAYLNPDALL